MTIPDTVTDSIAPRRQQGRLAFITGAGQGNGRTLAQGLSYAGGLAV